MSKRFIYLCGIVLTILIGTLLYWWFCCRNDHHAKAEAAVSTGTVSGFDLGGNGFNYHCSDNFKFPVNGFDFQTPVGDSINIGIAQLKALFEKSPLQKLKISGFCTPAEPNGSAFPNLGFARANAVKNYFVSQGIPSAAIDIDGIVKDSLDVRDNIVFGPLNFVLSAVDTAVAANPAADPEALKKELNANPLVLYFKSGQTSIDLSPEQRQQVLKIVDFLGKTPDAKLLVTGYTDNVGKREGNVKIGQERADFAKAYFAKNGIAEALIESASKGPDDPIADNNTEDGRAKNRRTVITIK